MQAVSSKHCKKDEGTVRRSQEEEEEKRRRRRRKEKKKKKSVVKWVFSFCEEEAMVNEDIHKDRVAVTKHMKRNHFAIWLKDREEKLKMGRVKSSFSPAVASKASGFCANPRGEEKGTSGLHLPTL